MTGGMHFVIVSLILWNLLDWIGDDVEQCVKAYLTAKGYTVNSDAIPIIKKHSDERQNRIAEKYSSKRKGSRTRDK